MDTTSRGGEGKGAGADASAPFVCSGHDDFCTTCPGGRLDCWWPDCLVSKALAQRHDKAQARRFTGEPLTGFAVLQSCSDLEPVATGARGVPGAPAIGGAR